MASKNIARRLFRQAWLPCLLLVAAAVQAAGEAAPIAQAARSQSAASDTAAARERQAALRAELAAAPAGSMALRAWLLRGHAQGWTPERAVQEAPEAARALLALEARVADAYERGDDLALLDTTAREADVSRLSPVGFFEVVDTAFAQGAWDQVWQLYLSRLRERPADFTTVWGLLEHLQSDSRAVTYQALRGVLAEPGLRGTPAARVLQRAMGSPKHNRLDMLGWLAREWPAKDSSWALHRYVANARCTLFDIERCLAAHEMASRALPELPSNAVRWAATLEDAGRAQDAAAVLSAQAQRHSPAGARAQWMRNLRWRVAQQRNHWGDQEALALEAAPVALEGGWVQLAQLRMHQQRWDQAAAAWQHVLSISPRHHRAWLGRVQALRQADDTDGALAQVEAARQALGRYTPALLTEAMNELLARGRAKEALAWGGRLSPETWVDAPWWRTLGRAANKAGQPALARQLLQQALEVGAVEREMLDEILATWPEKERPQADAWLAVWAQAHPGSNLAEDIWQSRQSNPPADQRATLQRLDQAILRAPQHHWPAYYKAWESMEAQRGEEVLSIMDAALARVGQEHQGQRGELLGMSADLLIRIERNGQGRQSSWVDEAERRLNEAVAMGISRPWALQRFAELADLKRKPEEAARRLLDQAALQPSAIGPVDALLRHDSELARKHRWTVLHRLIQRDPDDFDARITAIHFHVLWGGSPVVGLAHAQFLEKRFPARWANSRGPGDKRQALQQLGDAQRFYREEYDNSSAVPSGQRYVQWFDEARAKAQRDGAQLIDERLDLLRMRATVIGTDGVEVERGWHAVSGKSNYLRVGRAEMRAEYDDAGVNLLKVVDSGGQWLSLAYDDNDQIRTMQSQAGLHLQFAYGPLGKPVHIQLKGVGEVRVRYDASGEIEGVDSDTPQIGLKISQTFQQLLSQVKALEGGRGEWPDLPLTDPRLDQLRAAVDKARPVDRPKASLDLAAHLVEHVGDQRQRVGQARALLADLLTPEQGPHEGMTPTQVKAVGLWYALARKLYAHGLTASDWQAWGEMQSRLAVAAGRPAQAEEAARLLSQIAEQPLSLMAKARWLPRSYLDNPGAWRRYGWNRVLPEGVTPRSSALLVRRNGDLVLGTDKGLAVLRKGFWEWMAWDGQSRRFSQNLSPYSATQLSVTALAEDEEGQLWVGGNQGLAILSGDYEATAKWLSGPLQGLPSASIRQLLPWRGGMLVATQEGLRWGTAVAWRELPASWLRWQQREVTLLRSGVRDAVLVGSTEGLWRADAQDATALLPTPVDDAVMVGDSIHVLQRQEVRTMQLPDAAQKPGPLRPLPDHANILRTKRIESLTLVPVGGGLRLGIVTDAGLSVFHDAHVEHKKLPLTDRDAGALRAAAAPDGLVLVGPDGVFRVKEPRQLGDEAGPVYDILTVPEVKATFVARGQRLEVVLHDSPAQGARSLASLRSKRLARSAQGELITHDGDQVVKVDPRNGNVTELFKAPGRGTNGRPGDSEIAQILVSRDDSIWVASGASLFRHAEGRTTEFSIFTDEEKFPARSHYISRVIETEDGELWVVASNEGHLKFRGRPMTGGLLRWNGQFFERMSPTSGVPWFMTSYTAIGDGQAVIGTNEGFVLRRDGQLDRAARTGGASYAALMARQRMLFLGTKGARLGDSWLFGTAGGIVALHEGRWMPLDRLNWLLPEPFLALYGSRTVHAVETDAAGRIYAGTDRGLLIYETGGQDFMQLLVHENLSDLAFSDLESRKLRAEAGAWLKHLPPTSRAGQLLQSVRQSESGLVQVRAQVEASRGLATTRATGTGEQKAPAPVAGSPSLAQELERRELAHKRLLAKVEQDALGLYQMLELKPIDLSAWRKRLAEGAVVVQYLPTPKKLMIHIAGPEISEVREVEVSDEILYERSMTAARALGRAAKSLPVLRGASRTEPPSLAQALNDVGADARLDSDLQWLYEHLIRPIERDLEGRRHVYIAPVGALAHVPFGALVRGDGEKKQYAAERYAIGILPSLYLLDLVTQARVASTGKPVLFGDPDGSLPAARQEVQSVQALLGVGTDSRIGSQATRAALVSLAGKARWLHLATHGVLKGEDPTQSYLLLAEGERLNMVDAMELPLSRTDTVVLSACESGVGRRGLDYATLSRAFGYAGAPSVVASLWSVHDDATRLLMEQFYLYRQQGLDVFVSLARAQRDLIGKGGASARPEAWSAFQAIGRP